MGEAKLRKKLGLQPTWRKPEKPPEKPTPYDRFHDFHDRYVDTFIKKHGPFASELVITIAAMAVLPSFKIMPVSKAALIRQLDYDEDTAEALHFLETEGMIEINGDEIKIPAHWLT